MKVHVSKNQLADVLGHVERIVPARSSNPGLSLVRIKLEEQLLVFSGSNMDIDIEAQLPADVTGNGEIAVPAGVLGQVVRALPGDDVELSIEEQEMGLSSGTYSTRLQLVDPDQAPALDFEDSYDGLLPAPALHRILSNVRYATATADYQAIFRGVKLELSDSRTRAIASDGFRLAYDQVEESSGLDAQVVVPARSVDEMIRVLGEGEAQLSANTSQLSLKCSGIRMNLKLMEGTFPDYERIIPHEFPVAVSVNARELSQAVSRVSLMADRTTNNRVDLFVHEGTVQITAEGSFGRSQEAVTVQQEGSEHEIAVAFNAKYLTDALSPLGGRARISLSRDSAPTVMVDPDTPGYLAMVVPLRTT